MEEISPDKWEEATHPIVFFVIGFTEIEIRGFQVLQVSSPRLGWSQGVSLCRRSVGLSDWKKGQRSEVMLVWFFFPLDFGRSGLGISKNEEVFIRLIYGQTILPGNSTFLIPASKLYKCCSSCCWFDSSKVQHQQGCAGPPCCHSNCWPP